MIKNCGISVVPTVVYAVIAAAQVQGEVWWQGHEDSRWEADCLHKSDAWRCARRHTSDRL